MTPGSLEQWFLSPAALPIWQNALDGDYNERTIAQPEPCSESYLAAKRIMMADMGITYKSLPWK